MTRPSQAKAGAIEKQTAASKAQLSVEERRRALARKLAIFASDWRRCTRPQCRRARACRLPDLTCFSPKPRREMTPEQETAMLAKVKRMLERRLAEIRS